MNNLPVLKPPITSFSSVSDCKMVINELIKELAVFDDETNAKIIELLNAKKVEVVSRCTH